MSRFQGAYERLYRAMKTSLESESRLFKRCNELNQTIVSNAARVKAALRLTQEDSATIKLLKSEVEKAWKLVALSKEKDDKKSKHIDSLKEQIEQMGNQIRGGTGLQISADIELEKLQKQCDSL